jgi:hypothetical protein
MDAHAVSTYRTVINAPHLNLSMSTSHPPNVYTSSYRHQLAASQSRPLPPPPSYLHQPYPTNDNHPQPPLQVARSSFRDPASSDQPSPNRDGGDPYSNRKKRDTWDARLERKTRPATIAELAEKSREDLCDPNKHLKHWLTHRRTRKEVRETVCGERGLREELHPARQGGKHLPGEDADPQGLSYASDFQPEE